MLNRTNRTLSATKTGLNLGTRSFALAANANLDGKTTLRFPARLVAVRVGGWEDGVDIGADAITSRSYPPHAGSMSLVPPPGSSPMSLPASSRQRGTRMEPQGQTTELARAIAARALRMTGVAPQRWTDHFTKTTHQEPTLGSCAPWSESPACCRPFAWANPQSPCRFPGPDIRP